MNLGMGAPILTQTRGQSMHVGIDQTGQHRASLQVDHSRMGTAILFQNIGGLADIDDFSILNCDCFLNGKRPVDGDDFSPMQNQVCVGRQNRKRQEQEAKKVLQILHLSNVFSFFSKRRLSGALAGTCACPAERKSQKARGV